MLARLRNQHLRRDLGIDLDPLERDSLVAERGLRLVGKGREQSDDQLVTRVCHAGRCWRIVPPGSTRWPLQAGIAKQGWEVDDGESWIALWALALPARGVSGGLRQGWRIALDVGPGLARHRRADDSGIPTG